MKNEDAFNAYLSKKFNALPGTARLKMAEKYHIGVPDFALWRSGRSVAVESKFIQTIDGKPQLLKHPFTGPQQSFMKEMALAGVPSFGLVGVNDERRMYLIPAWRIPPSGNFNGGWLQANSFPPYEFGDEGRLADCMFRCSIENGQWTCALEEIDYQCLK